MRHKARKLLLFVFLLLIYLISRQLSTIIVNVNKLSVTPDTNQQNFDDAFGSILNKLTQGPEPHDGFERIDWHNYQQIELDKQKSGPGEHGIAVRLLKGEQTSDAYRENGFNIKVSNRISLDRSLPDIRTKQCKRRKYLRELPTVSVIIPFHNEGFTTLLRSIHSVINRSPPHLLKEIILIDDFSDMKHLGEQLDNKLGEYPKVQLKRLKKREGLIRARLAGVDMATSDIIVILDSHIEVTSNWLPPLIEPIALNRSTITCPMIDVIDNENFQYKTQAGDAMRGAFDWELYYKRIPIPDHMKPNDPSDPFEDPVMAGGLFAANRLYFNEIGKYDPGLEIWGGEQYELSFKVWMCGGRILDTPCSRVGHIYRKFVPYKSLGNSVNRNYKRVAEIWMDEYKEYLYKKRPNMRYIDIGDIEEQKQLRNDLKCRTFKWFMTQVAPDIIKYYPPEIPQPAAWGNIMSNNGNCIEIFPRGKISVRKCNNLKQQSFLLTWTEDIRTGVDQYKFGSECFDGQSIGREIILYPCHQMRGNQLWKYLQKEGWLYHSQTESCATFIPMQNDGNQNADGKIVLQKCDHLNEEQVWKWQNINLDKLNHFNKNRHQAASDK